MGVDEELQQSQDIVVHWKDPSQQEASSERADSHHRTAGLWSWHLPQGLYSQPNKEKLKHKESSLWALKAHEATQEARQLAFQSSPVL